MWIGVSRLLQVCGPNVNYDKRMLWDELVGLISWWNLLWCNGGDFNIIHFPSERSSNTSSFPAMLEFSESIF